MGSNETEFWVLNRKMNATILAKSESVSPIINLSVLKAKEKT